tara:strand:- start:1123 stop:1992 length:870 start_codon:yes stop_codon:yes gene_type:complete
MKVRQSTLGSADKCLRALQYDLENPVYHGGSTRALGTAFHHGLETFYQPGGMYIPMADLLLEAEAEFDRCVSMEPSHESEKTKTAGEFRWDENVPDSSTAYELLAVMIPAYVTEHAWPIDHDWAVSSGSYPKEGHFGVLGTEMSFNLPFFDKHTSNGSMDLTLVDHLGWIVGVDFKTAGRMWPKGKEHPRKQNQAPWYVRALQELYPDAPGYRFVFDIITLKGKFERRIADPSQGHIDAVERKAIQVVSLYEGMRASGLDLPANPANTLCNPKWCDHWDVCEYGAALDS